MSVGLLSSFFIVVFMAGGMILMLLAGLMFRTMFLTRTAQSSKEVPRDVTLACPHCGRETAANRLDCQHCGESLAGGP